MDKIHLKEGKIMSKDSVVKLSKLGMPYSSRSPYLQAVADYYDPHYEDTQEHIDIKFSCYPRANPLAQLKQRQFSIR